MVALSDHEAVHDYAGQLAEVVSRGLQSVTRGDCINRTIVALAVHEIGFEIVWRVGPAIKHGFAVGEVVSEAGKLTGLPECRLEEVRSRLVKRSLAHGGFKHVHATIKIPGLIEDGSPEIGAHLGDKQEPEKQSLFDCRPFREGSTVCEVELVVGLHLIRDVIHYV